MNATEYMLRPIGKVRVEGNDPRNAEYFLDIEKPFRSGLKELDKWSHVIVLYWGDQMDTQEYRNSDNWAIEIPYAEGAPKTGIFATRAEYRPNPILMTTAKIIELKMEEGIVQLSGLDAYDGTPVVDLKAYYPMCDKVRDVHIAPWLSDWPECLEDGITWWEEQGFFEDYE